MTGDTAVDRPRFRRAGPFIRRVLLPLVNAASRLGFTYANSGLLTVRGRKSGRDFDATVNVLDIDGRRYLVAPRGETHWVRNLRVAGEGRLRIGKAVSGFHARELPDAEKPPLLRAYLERWAAQVPGQFAVTWPGASEADLAAIAHQHPVFILEG